ncbi:SDR family NAD(P)-dependent oxidoreductase, partial [Halorubrum sp. Atlit-28R]
MKVIVITGGSRGIGAATARLAAARGYAVCISYRSDRQAAEATVS